MSLTVAQWLGCCRLLDSLWPLGRCPRVLTETVELKLIVEMTRDEAVEANDIVVYALTPWALFTVGAE